MSGPKFDINDGDFIFGDDNMGIDSDGHMMMGMGGNMMMDMETGDIHFTSGDSNNHLGGGFNAFDDEDDDW